MCKFTIATLECGHPQEDHVDTYGCPYYEKSSLHCDRDNPNNKSRCTIRTFDRDGICNRCLSLARKREEEAIEREQRKYDEQRRREAVEAEEALRRGERENLEKQYRQAEQERLAANKRHSDALEAHRRQEEAHRQRTAEVERESREKYDREIQAQLDRDMEYMMRQSREEAARREKEEEEEIQRALKESARMIQMERSYSDDPSTTSSGHRDRGDDRIASWLESTSRTNSHSNSNADYPPMSASPPSPPATPPRMSLPPPAPAPAPAPKPAVNAAAAPRPPPAPAPAPKPAQQQKEINYSLPAVGDQKIGRFRLGSRAVPIHESQDIPDAPPAPPKPMSPSARAPMVRLGGAIPASDVPIVREIKGQVRPVPTAMDNNNTSATTMRKPSVSRKPPPPVPAGKDPQLEALLAKRRAWEPEDEDATITPPRSPSKGQSPARRMTQTEFDSKRKAGWKNHDDDE